MPVQGVQQAYLYCLSRGYSRPIFTACPGGAAGLFVLPIQRVQQAYLYYLSRGYSRPICPVCLGGTVGLFVLPARILLYVGTVYPNALIEKFMKPVSALSSNTHFYKFFVKLITKYYKTLCTY